MILRCDECPAILSVPDEPGEWIEHHADGSHTHHPRAAWIADQESEGSDHARG